MVHKNMYLKSKLKNWCWVFLTVLKNNKMRQNKFSWQLKYHLALDDIDRVFNELEKNLIFSTIL